MVYETGWQIFAEYRKLKSDKNILDIVKNPRIASEICLQPVDILEVDAAILYADIMIPLLGIGVDLEIVESLGPVIKNPLQHLEDVKRLRELDPQMDIPYLLETIKIVQSKLKNKVPLIGFSAAPFTLASYLIEGRPSRDFIKTKSFIYAQPEAWQLLMGKLTKLIVTYLQAQKKAGVQVIQLFDSWVGTLSESDYQQFVLPATAQIFAQLQDGKVPLIHFGTNTAHLLKPFSSVSCNVVSIDWRLPLSEAWQIIGPEKSIQGNLDPAILLNDFSIIKAKVDQILADLPKKDGYIFNLGHGVLPNTPVQNLIELVQYIHHQKIR